MKCCFVTSIETIAYVKITQFISHGLTCVISSTVIGTYIWNWYSYFMITIKTYCILITLYFYVNVKFLWNKLLQNENFWTLFMFYILAT